MTRFRFVLTVSTDSPHHLAVACDVFRCHLGTIGIEKLSSGSANWLVQASSELPDETTAQSDAADWHVKPVVAGLVAANVIRAVNWQSCRRMTEDGLLVGDELEVW